MQNIRKINNYKRMAKMVNFSSNKLLKLFILTIGITASLTAYGADDSNRERMTTTSRRGSNTEIMPQIQTTMFENSTQVEQLRTIFAQNAETANTTTSSDVPQNEEVITRSRAAVFIQKLLDLETSILEILFLMVCQ